MSIIQGIERSAIFGIARAVAWVGIAAALIASVGGLVYGIVVWHENVALRVTPQDIVARLDAAAASSAAAASDAAAGAATQPSALQGYRIPFPLQKYVSGDNAQVIRGHLDDGAAADHQAYLDELGAVVTAAEARHLNAVDAINLYMKTKGGRYAEQAALKVRKWETLTWVGEAVAAGLLLLALFSVVLVLLAIERHLRHARVMSAGGAAQMPAKTQTQTQTQTQTHAQMLAQTPTEPTL
ncbi:MAG: hypothetical protein ACRYHA_33415 [Janthinobacterium lividum]